MYEKTSLELIFFVISDKERSLLFSNTSKYNMMLNVFKKKIEEEEGPCDEFIPYKWEMPYDFSVRSKCPECH